MLYLAPQGHMLGSVDEVMRSETLTQLYGAPVTVAQVAGKLVVI